MRYPSDHKEKTRARIVDSAGRLFRARGYEGIGVDGLMQAAELTSGAFYGHFKSKTAVFTEVVRIGLDRFQARVRRMQKEDPEGWLPRFASWYLSQAHRANIEGGCALPSLSPEVVRADPAIRETYEAGLEEATAAMLEGAPFKDAPDAREKVWAVLALLAGGVTLARAVPTDAASAEISAAVVAAVLRISTEQPTTKARRARSRPRGS